MEQRRQALACIRAIARLTSKAVGLNDEHAVLRNLACRDAFQTPFHILGQLRACEIVAKLHCRGDFVNVLAAGTRRANEAFFNERFVDVDCGSARRHWYSVAQRQAYP